MASVNSGVPFQLVENQRNSDTSLVLRCLVFATNTIEKTQFCVRKYFGNTFSLLWTNPATKKPEYLVSLPDIQKIVKDLIAQKQIPSEPIEDLGLL